MSFVQTFAFAMGLLGAACFVGGTGATAEDASIPPIDEAAPSQFETATFSLG
jgi:hypothetical protein